MTLTFLCVNAGRKTGKDNRIVYYAMFGKTNTEEIGYFGQLQLESFEPMHYKPGGKYTINISEHSGIKIVGSIPKGTRLN